MSTDLNLKGARFTGVRIKGQPAKKYQVSIARSISRILTTRLGERVMRPEFGSDLYRLRDRDFDSRWRVLATRYIFEAIKRFEPRVRFKRLGFKIEATTGRHTFSMELEARA